MTRRPLMLVSLAMLAACSYRPNPIPVAAAAPADLSSLRGSWSGTYTGTESGRNGAISFTLTAGTDTAHGEVLMVPAGMNTPIVRATDGPGQQRDRPSTEMLTIAFARIENGQISGRLDPYRDPACACLVNTRFTGALLDSSTLEGTFATTGMGLSAPQGGRWKVTRVKP